MRYVIIAPVLSLIIMFFEVIISKNNLKWYLAKVIIICSSILFLFGGVVNILILAINITIPVHYHGSVNAITIAFMGFAYFLCNNGNKVSPYFSMAIITLTIGQMLHIIALLLAEGGGVLMREAPGRAGEFSSKLLIGLTEAGGLMEIVGGLMFVIICGKQMLIINKINII